MKNTHPSKDEATELEVRRKNLLEFIFTNPPSQQDSDQTDPASLGTSEYVSKIMSKSKHVVFEDKRN